ncbi:MAG TPA: malonyl-ACP O-methyltransferase BioC, partial [Steroidobacteraceae bacterium]|nr:malonyl-ACP O-methyltransferase BioC [Steroidobacteraceae bacterium]
CRMADEFFLDPRAVRRSFDRAGRTYDASAAVQAEIRARLLERLDIVRLQPAAVLDLGAGTGHSSRALKRRYPAAQVIALDASLPTLRESARQQRFLRRFAPVCADAHRLPLRSQSFELVLSNLLLEWCHDPDVVFAEAARVLRPQGLFTFTTLGPDTLKEVRELWRGVDHFTHVHRFIDMHDFGDALVRAGFAEPVMDTERLTVTYPDLATLVGELRGSGARNIAQGRPRGLTSRARGATLRSRSDDLLRNGPLRISVEVIHGHAWAVGERLSRRAGDEVLVPFESLRTRRKS